MSFTIVPKKKKKKYLGINPKNIYKKIYVEAYKALMKEIKENLNKWRDILCP